MDDKTKVQLCKEIIRDFRNRPRGEDCEYRTVMDAVFVVLAFGSDEEGMDGGK